MNKATAFTDLLPSLTQNRIPLTFLSTILFEGDKDTGKGPTDSDAFNEIARILSSAMRLLGSFRQQILEILMITCLFSGRIDWMDA